MRSMVSMLSSYGYLVWDAIRFTSVGVNTYDDDLTTTVCVRVHACVYGYEDDSEYYIRCVWNNES